MFRGSFLTQKKLVVFVLLALSISQTTVNADESILFEISPNKKQFNVDLGIVQPKSVLNRTLLVTGARSSESDKLTISASCGCLSTTIGERTTERVLELHVSLASGSKDGKSEQKIDIIRESDSAVIGSLVFTQEVRSKVTLSSYSVDVTDLLGGEVELAIVVPDVYKNEDVAITGVTGEGDWLADAGVKLVANRQAILLSVKEKIDAKETSSVQQLHLDWRNKDGIGKMDVEVTLKRKAPLHLLKNSLWLLEDGESLTGKLWLRGNAGFADDVRSLDGKLKVGNSGSPLEEAAPVLFSRVSESLWIGKVKLKRQFVEANAVEDVLKHTFKDSSLEVSGLVFPVFLNVGGVSK
jgi:hypothetical protein